MLFFSFRFLSGARCGKVELSSSLIFFFGGVGGKARGGKKRESLFTLFLKKSFLRRICGRSESGAFFFSHASFSKLEIEKDARSFPLFS